MKVVNIMSPAIALIALAILVAGGMILTKYMRHKYECTPEREKELEEKTEKGDLT